MSELKWEPFLSASEIGVTVKNGGMRSLAEKKNAEDAAWMAPGVILVVNELRVDVPVFAD